jgi:hypothetical protein
MNRRRRPALECRPRFSLNMSRLRCFPMTEYSTTFLINRVETCTGFRRCRWLASRQRSRSVAGITVCCRRDCDTARPAALWRATRVECRRTCPPPAVPHDSDAAQHRSGRETRLSTLLLGLTGSPAATQMQEMVHSGGMPPAGLPGKWHWAAMCSALGWVDPQSARLPADRLARASRSPYFMPSNFMPSGSRKNTA